MKKFLFVLVFISLALSAFCNPPLPKYKDQIIWESPSFSYKGKQAFSAQWYFCGNTYCATFIYSGEFKDMNKKEIYILGEPFLKDDPSYLKVLNLRDNLNGTFWVDSWKIEGKDYNVRKKVETLTGRGLGT